MFPKVNCQHLEENASGDCRSLYTFLSTSRTRLSGEWLRYSWPCSGAKRFIRWPLPAIFYMCIGFILNQNTTNGNLALKRAQVLSNTFGSAFPLPLFNQIFLLLLSSYSPSCVPWSPGPFAYRFTKLFYSLGLYYHLVFQSLCLPASLPSITLSDRI